MDVYGAIFSQSVQSRTKNRLFFVKRVDTRKPILLHENAIVYSKTLGAFREPISTPALIRRQIVRQCRNTCTMAFTMIGCVWFTSKSELAIRVTVCVAGGVARGIVDLSRVLSRGSRSPRLAVQPRHDPLRVSTGFCRVCNIKGRLKNDDASRWEGAPYPRHWRSNLLPLINENQDDSIPSS